MFSGIYRTNVVFVSQAGMKSGSGCRAELIFPVGITNMRCLSQVHHHDCFGDSMDLFDEIGRNSSFVLISHWSSAEVRFLEIE